MEIDGEARGSWAVSVVWVRVGEQYNEWGMKQPTAHPSAPVSDANVATIFCSLQVARRPGHSPSTLALLCDSGHTAQRLRRRVTSDLQAKT